MRLGCIAVLGGLYMLWSGGQGLYTAFTNREPLAVPCEGYLEAGSKREWLDLKGCSMSLMEASYTESDGKAVELFLPARGEDAEDGAPARVLVATKDEELLRLANELIHIQDESTLMQFAVEHHAEIFPRRDVRGLVRYGVDLDDDERAELEKLDATLAADFVILDEGREPGFGRSLGFVGGGVVLMLIAGAGFVGSAGSKS